MTAKEEFNKRHSKALSELQKAANPKSYQYGLLKCSNAIAANLGISFQTVINYVSGRAKDGYLTEAITKEFKQLQINE